jgi:hypothetical protein
MIAHWMLYCLAAAVLLAGAAVGAEAACRALRLPGRWPWVAAMALTVALPLAGWLRPAAPAAEPRVAEVVVLAPAASGPTLPLPTQAAVLAEWTRDSGLGALERPLAVGWALASGAALMAVAGMSALLAYRRRRWTAGIAAGEPVYYAPDTGPAVVGMVRGRIVLPEWAREAEPRVLETMVAHEREHLRTGDHRLLAVGLLATIAMPWNPAVWWQLRRLRLAVEVDCDARVLRSRADVRTYGRILLEVGRRACHLPLAAPALCQPVSFLEKRIRIMTSPRIRFPRIRAAACTAAAAGLLLGACEMATPSGPSPADVRRIHAADDAQPGLQPAELTPLAALERYYPDVLTRGAGDDSHFIFVISAEGQVVHHRRWTAPEPATTVRTEQDGRALRISSAPDFDVDPANIRSIDVLKMRAREAGPDPLTVFWIRKNEAGVVNEVAAGGAQVRVRGGGDGTSNRSPETAGAEPAGSRGTLVTVGPTEGGGERQLILSSSAPIDTGGVPENVVWIIVDAEGNEVHRGTRPTETLVPDDIATIEVRKGPAAQGGGEIHVRLKP